MLVYFLLLPLDSLHSLILLQALIDPLTSILIKISNSLEQELSYSLAEEERKERSGRGLRTLRKKLIFILNQSLLYPIATNTNQERKEERSCLMNAVNCIVLIFQPINGKREG